MFQGFDALPEALRPLAHEPQPKPSPAPEPPKQTLVDCAVYADGHRLPGKTQFKSPDQKQDLLVTLGQGFHGRT